MRSRTWSARPAVIAGPSEYPALLDAAWQDHLAPRGSNAPTVVSLFAGCGGSSLGYRMAGHEERLAVEWDAHAVATFRCHFPGVPLWQGDIAALSDTRALALAGLAPGELDVLDGSPPCQGFSTAGKRLLDDPRNQLFREYVRLLAAFRPKLFVVENVAGLVKGKMRLVFVEILRALRVSGYRVSARRLNAMWFHVPQSRERMIFIGVRDDLDITPSHPPAAAWPISYRAAVDGLTALDQRGPGTHPAPGAPLGRDPARRRASRARSARAIGLGPAGAHDPESTRQRRAHAPRRAAATERGRAAANRLVSGCVHVPGLVGAGRLSDRQ